MENERELDSGVKTDEPINGVFSEYIQKDETEIPIKVIDPSKRDGLKSYVVYKVVVNRKPDPVYRRYSDFFTLREKLIERWPGVYIPNIPPKKVVVKIKYYRAILRMKQY